MTQPISDKTDQFQDAGSQARNRIRDAIYELSQMEGQTGRTAVSGAAAAVVECCLDFRPAGMDPEEAAVRCLQMVELYCAQIVPQAEAENRHEVIN